jgi:glycine cleavage system transcriptional repressor
MEKYISLTAIGKDNPGIVSSITKVIYEEGCNVEDSTMTILHGQFAMILIVKIAVKFSIKAFFNKLQKVAKPLGMALSYAELPAYVPKRYKPANPCIISVYGSDRTGIVYNISKYLAENKVNIADVQTTLSKYKGKDTYIMIIECDVPKKKAYEKLSKDLLRLASHINVTISLNKAESADI